MAARYGCADCAAVLKEGLGIKEPSTEGLLVYGKCAAEFGQLTTGGFRLELDSPIDTALALHEPG